MGIANEQYVTIFVILKRTKYRQQYLIVYKGLEKGKYNIYLSLCFSIQDCKNRYNLKSLGNNILSVLPTITKKYKFLSCDFRITLSLS